MSNLQTYQGSCHCGNIAFEVSGNIDSALTCNCSICQRRGSMLWFTGRDNFKLLTPETQLSTYTFNKHVIQHHFCKVCGIHPFGAGKDPQGNDVVAINIRCLENFELDNIPVTHYDGRAL